MGENSLSQLAPVKEIVSIEAGGHRTVNTNNSHQKDNNYEQHSSSLVDNTN